MAMPIMRWKRTVPFSKNCAYSWMDADGFIEKCQEEAFFSLYYGMDLGEDGYPCNIVSLCIYHTVYQESIWIGKDYS